MLCIQDFYRAIDSFAPFDTAEAWDNPGLLLGSFDTPVSGALLALDVTEAVLEEAKKIGASLIITHHPIIFSPLRKIESDSLVYRLVQNGIAVISAHTNLDMADGGVNDVLAQRLQLCDVRKPEAPPSLLRVGELSGAMQPEAFAQYVKRELHAPGVRVVCGRAEIRTVAVCGGAGADRLSVAAKADAQAYVTADVKHHEWLESHRMGLTLIDAGHFSTEAPVLEPLRRRLAEILPQAMLTVSQSGTEQVKFI